MTTLPRLRRVDAQVVEWEGRTVICVRDLEGVLADPVLLSPRLYLVAALLDGDRSAADLQIAYAARTGDALPDADLARIVALLDDHGLLESPKLRQRRLETETAYRAAALRPAHHAGRSYPHDGGELRALIDSFFARVDRRALAGASARGAVAPHIDLPRGGVAYAWTHAGLQATPVETWIVLGVAHAGPPAPFVLSPKSFYTPLGTVPVDEEVAGALAPAAADGAAHEMAHRTEHSVEFQALFLGWAGAGRPRRIVPVLCSSFESRAGSESPSTVPSIERMIGTIRDVVARADGRIGVLASVDFSHVGPSFGDDQPVTGEAARAVAAADRGVLDAIVAGDAEAFWRAANADGNPRRIDASSAVYMALRALAPTRGRLLHYGQAPDPAGGLVSFASLLLE